LTRAPLGARQSLIPKAALGGSCLSFGGVKRAGSRARHVGGERWGCPGRGLADHTTEGASGLRYGCRQRGRARALGCQRGRMARFVGRIQQAEGRDAAQLPLIHRGVPSRRCRVGVPVEFGDGHETQGDRGSGPVRTVLVSPRDIMVNGAWVSPRKSMRETGHPGLSSRVGSVPEVPQESTPTLSPPRGTPRPWTVVNRRPLSAAFIPTRR